MSERPTEKGDTGASLTIQGEIADNPLAQALLAALPMAVVVVDEVLRIVAINQPARASFAAPGVRLIGEKAGDAFNCINALSSDGCGTSGNCGECQLRGTAGEAVNGVEVQAREIKVELMHEGRSASHYLLVHAGPFRPHGRRLALITFHDVSMLQRLRGLISICSACKAIHRDRKAWEALEGYLEDHSDAEFTHSICPDCRDKLYPLPSR